MDLHSYISFAPPDTVDLVTNFRIVDQVLSFKIYKLKTRIFKFYKVTYKSSPSV